MKLVAAFLFLTFCSTAGLAAMEKPLEITAISKPSQVAAVPEANAPDATKAQIDAQASPAYSFSPFFQMLLVLDKAGIELCAQQSLPLMVDLEGTKQLDGEKLRMLVAHMDLAKIALEKNLMKHQTANFHISCDPAPESLAKLAAPTLTAHRNAVTLENSKYPSHTIERCTAELSDTIRRLLSELDADSPIPLGLAHPQSLDCVVECLKKITKLGQCANYGATLHEELKPIIANTNILHLLATVNYLDIPVLFDYLAAYIANYIVQENDMHKLAYFLKSCSIILEKSLRTCISTQLMPLRRGKYMQLLFKETLHSHPLRNYGHPASTTCLTSSNDYYTCAIHNPRSKGYHRYKVQNGTMAFLSATRELPEFDEDDHVLINRQGTALVFQKVDEGLYSVDLTKPTAEVALIDPTEEHAQGFEFSRPLHRFSAINLDATMYLNGSGIATKIIDPDYAQPLVFQGLLIAYNGKYALTSYQLANFISKHAVLWRVEDNGSISRLKDIELPANCSKKPNPTVYPSCYLLSPLGSYLIYNTVISGCILIRDSQDHQIPSGRHLIAGQQLPVGRLYACSESGLIVQKSDYDLRIVVIDGLDTQQKTLCSISHDLNLGHSWSEYGIRKVIFHDNDSRIEIIYGVTKQKTSEEEVPEITIHSLIIDLFAEAKNLSLEQLVCLINFEHVHEDDYLKTIYSTIPDHIRARTVAKVPEKPANP